MNPSFDWNPPQPEQAVEIVDSTLYELLRDSSAVPPGLPQIVAWIDRMQRVGIRSFEALYVSQPSEETLATWAIEQLLGLHKSLRLIVNLEAGYGWPRELVGWARALGKRLEFRLVESMSSGPMAPPRELLELCRRLHEEGHPVTLVVPHSHAMDPVLLSRWVSACDIHGVDVLELNVAGGAPWRAGIESLIAFTQGLIPPGGRPRRLSWHSQEGGDLALAQGLQAWRCGVGQLRTSLFGCGRQGAIPLELLLMNLAVSAPPDSCRGLKEACDWARQQFDLEIPSNYPIFGRDAFSSASAQPAEQLWKARQHGLGDVAERLFSSVAASALGQVPRLRVGPASGRATLAHWMESMQLDSHPALLEQMHQVCTSQDHCLSDLELLDTYHQLKSRSYEPEPGLCSWG